MTETQTTPTDPIPDQDRISELEAQLSERDARLASITRTTRIDQLLRDARVIDADVARLVIEQQVGGSDRPDDEAEPDIPAIVQELLRSKPFLFEPARRSRASASSPRVDSEPTESLREAAVEAHVSQRRGDLLKYLRLKRRFNQRE